MNKKVKVSEVSGLDYRTAEAWDTRYHQPCGSGTFVHSVKGNRQFYRAKFDALARVLRACHTSVEQKAVADLAGGDGALIPFLLERGAKRVHVEDFSNVAIQYVKEKYRDNVLVTASVGDLRWPDARYVGAWDIVFVLEAIFLLPSADDLERALLGIAGQLRSGGLLVVSDHFGDIEVKMPPYVCHRARSLFEGFAAGAGLEVVGYWKQTSLFNCRLFGKFQRAVERSGNCLYFLDRLAQAIGINEQSKVPIRYCAYRRH